MWTELQSLLTAYLEGRASRYELGVWLAEFDWDSADPEAVALQDDVATLDLILTEVVEGLRPESELREIAARLANVGSNTDVYAGSVANVDDRNT